MPLTADHVGDWGSLSRSSRVRPGQELPVRFKIRTSWILAWQPCRGKAAGHGHGQTAFDKKWLPPCPKPEARGDQAGSRTGLHRIIAWSFWTSASTGQGTSPFDSVEVVASLVGRYPLVHSEILIAAAKDRTEPRAHWSQRKQLGCIMWLMTRRRLLFFFSVLRRELRQ
jgi:hypothetical protein